MMANGTIVHLTSTDVSSPCVSAHVCVWTCSCLHVCVQACVLIHLCVYVLSSAQLGSSRAQRRRQSSPRRLTSMRRSWTTRRQRRSPMPTEEWQIWTLRPRPMTSTTQETRYLWQQRWTFLPDSILKLHSERQCRQCMALFSHHKTRLLQLSGSLCVIYWGQFNVKLWNKLERTH